MKTLFTLALLIASQSSFAQTATTPALDQLYPGYPATVFDSKAQVDEIFSNRNKMPLGFRGASWIFGGGSQCFHRAEIWSYNLYRNYQVNAMKVFVFYTHQFKRAYKDMKNKKFDWWFHVAPYVIVRDPATSAIKEYVIDPTFAETPLEMKPWTDMFVETHRKCAEFVPFEKFRREVENGPNAVFGTEHCYIVRVPATDFSPVEVAARTAGLTSGYNWNGSQIKEALDNAPTARNKDDYKRMLGF